MAEEDQGEKTEDPTPQRREDFRKRGQVAQTREMASVFVLLGSLLVMWFLGRFFLERVHLVFTRSFTEFVITSARTEDWVMAFKFAIKQSALIVLPLGGILWAMSVASSIVQVGFIQNEEALKLKPERLNPIEGFKRIFSMKSFVEGAKAVLKLLLVGAVIYFVMSSEIPKFPNVMNYEVSSLLLYIGTLLLKLFGWVGVFMLGLSLMDFGFQRWDLEKKMRMTKHEVKEEIKSREGDPLVRARVRKLQKELAQRRMMDDVPKADVIITNPTHIAVALKYSKEMLAPKLLAKGAGEIAEKIKKIGRDKNIPVVENKPLARTIFKTLKIGQIIPRELYAAVAEVLSYVFKLKKKRIV